MSFWKVVFLVGAGLVFIFATFVSWYEGGQLLDRPTEWKPTAVFSNWLNDGVASSNDILWMDHFVYASKFEPVFPLMMVISLLIVSFQVVLWVFKNHTAARNLFFLLMTAVSFALSGMLCRSPTTGLTLFSLLFVLVGMLSLLGVFQKSKYEAIERM